MSVKKAYYSDKKEVIYDQTARPVVDVNIVCDPKDYPRMVAIINRLAKSPRGRETLEVAQKGHFEFGFFDENEGCYGACDKAGNWVRLNPMASDDKLVGTLSHECRHAGQFIRGAHETFGKQNLKSELIMFRAMEADAQTNAVTACYELAQQGDTAPYEIFKNTYPEIEEAFHNALVANNGVVNHDVMTAAFKGWYDQNGTKRVYEQAYELEPMADEIIDLRNDREPTLLYDEPFDTDALVKMATYTDEGSYFTENPSILESGKYLDVAESTKREMEDFFEIRRILTGLPADKTLAEIPTRPDYPSRRARAAVKTTAANGISNAVLAAKMHAGR